MDAGNIMLHSYIYTDHSTLYEKYGKEQLIIVALLDRTCNE